MYFIYSHLKNLFFTVAILSHTIDAIRQQQQYHSNLKRLRWTLIFQENKNEQKQSTLE